MKIVRYFFVGAAAATVDVAVFGLLVKVFGFPWFPVALFSFCLATAVNYALSIRHVFQSGLRFSRTHEISLVFLASAIGLVINQAALWFLIERLLLDALLAKVLASMTVFFWNYGARRRFIFKDVG